MKFIDAAQISGTRLRDDGALLAYARIARTGIQLYSGSEVGKPSLDTVRVYRPGSEVFSPATMASAAHKPLTNDHPDDLVSADNWKAHAVGSTSDEVTGEGIFLRVPLMVSDGATVKLIKDGKRELSAGYTCDLDFTSGKTPSGEAFDAVQRNIRINHVAVVSAGRAGDQVRIGDAGSWGISPSPLADERKPSMSDALRTVMVNDLSVSTTDQGAQAISKLLADLATSTARIDALTATHASALAAKDAELARKDAELDAVKAKIVSDADLDRRVAARSDLIAKAKSLVADVKTDGLSDAAIRKAVVTSIRGAEKVADKSEAYIDAAFELLLDGVVAGEGDPLRAALASFKPSLTDAAASEKARSDYITSMRDAWKGTAPATH